MADNSPSPTEIETPGEDRSLRWIRIDQIFQQAIQLPEDERAHYVDQQCGSDDALRCEVLRWLESDRQACQEAFLDGLELRNADATPEIAEEAHTFIGQQLGPYTIVERIAAGAMGVVYRGQRTEGYRQQVAIKVLRPWLCDDENIARFRAEQQALADLPHPNIARLLDAGVTFDGAHYLILEYIEGYRLDEAVAAMQPSLEIRLQWFLQLCRAVAFAHDRGIAHRDLKPANILLAASRTPSPRPSPPQAGAGDRAQAGERGKERSVAAAGLLPTITDFGLAKITGNHAHALTATGEILGTPGYMAPEQIEGMAQGSGTSIDVYGLGAVLYFLLTGKPPFRGGSITELIRELERHDPDPPASLEPGVPLDLNTICLKCLQKQPQDRYATVNELADEIQRYLAGFPVLARPIGAFGRLIRWSRRNRRVAALTGLLGATLAAALIVTTSLFLLAERERRISEEERESAIDTIDRMLTEVSKSLANQPASSEVRQSLLAAAKEAYDARVARRNNDSKRLQVEAATATYRLAQICRQALNMQESDRLARNALRQFRQLADRYPDDHAFQFDVFHCLFLLGDYEPAYEQVWDLSRRYPLQDYRQAAATAAFLFAHALRPTDPDRAQTLIDDGLAVARALSTEFPDELRFLGTVGQGYSCLATLKIDRGDLAEALSMYESAIAIREQMVGAAPREPGFREELAGDLRQAAYLAARLQHGSQATDYLARASQVTRDGIQLRPQHFQSWWGYFVSLRDEMTYYPGEFDPLDRELSQLVEEALFAIKSARQFWPQSDHPLDLLHAELLADCPLEPMRDLAEADRLTSHLTPDNVTIQGAGCLAVVYLRLGRFEDAVACCRRAGWDWHDPGTGPWSLYPALALAQMGDIATAERIVQDQSPFRHALLYRRLRAEFEQIKQSRETVAPDVTARPRS